MALLTSLKLYVSSLLRRVMRFGGVEETWATGQGACFCHLGGLVKLLSCLGLILLISKMTGLCYTFLIVSILALKGTNFITRICLPPTGKIRKLKKNLFFPFSS